MDRGRELMGKSRSKSPKLSMIFSHSAGMINCDNVPVKDKTITGVVSASSNNPDLAEPLIESEDHHTDTRDSISCCAKALARLSARSPPVSMTTLRHPAKPLSSARGSTFGRL